MFLTKRYERHGALLNLYRSSTLDNIAGKESQVFRCGQMTYISGKRLYTKAKVELLNQFNKKRWPQAYKHFQFKDIAEDLFIKKIYPHGISQLYG